MKLKNDLFLRACRKEKVERTPIWMMRQAGRYLPEYRAVREKADFLTMCKTPELAAEVTIQPVNLIGVDAAIIFSDILVIPEAMGITLEMKEKEGPVLHNPIRDYHAANSLRRVRVNKDLKYVLDAIKLTKKELNQRVPLIGFSGSPWTLLTYMVEGRGSKNFDEVKKLIYSNPKLAHKILDKISDSVADYLSAQIDAGADAIQIFDTWGGILAPNEFVEFSLNYVEKIIDSMTRNGQPIIFFAKGVHYKLKRIAKSGVDVLGVDWTMDLGKVRELTKDKIALQGNLDPSVLLARKNVIKQKAIEVLKSFGKGEGHIFNLGHGILPNVSPENAKYLVSIVKQESKKFHKADKKKN